MFVPKSINGISRLNQNKNELKNKPAKGGLKTKKNKTMKKEYKKAICLITVDELSRGVCPVGAETTQTVLVREVPLNKENQACPVATDGSPIDTSLLVGASTKIVSFSPRNSEATTQNLIFGTEAGFEGTNTRFDLPASAVDANVADEFGNHVQKVQGFNALICNHSAIISKIEVFTQDEAQRNQRWTRVTLDLDANNCDIKGRIPVTDTQINAVTINGVFPLTDRDGLQYPLLAAVLGVPREVEIQFTVLSEALIELFQKGSTN